MIGKIKLVEELYSQLKLTLLIDGRYLDKDSLKQLNIPGIEEDVTEIEEYLGVKLGPKTSSEHKHVGLVKKIISKSKAGQNPKKEIEQAAILRHSLG